MTTICPACRSNCLYLHSPVQGFPFLSGSYNFLSCSSCGHTHISFKPQSNLYNNRESSTNYNKQGPFLFIKSLLFRFYANKYILPVVDFIPVSDSFNILDYGCGSGELSNSLITLLRSRYKLNRRCRLYAFDLQESPPNCLERAVTYLNPSSLKIHTNKFDCIILRHVLEHIDLLDDCILELHSLLNYNGKILIEVPNGDSSWRSILGYLWPGYFFPYHFHVFTEKSLWHLLNRHHLQVERIFYPNPPLFGVFANNFIRSLGLCKFISIFLYPLQYAFSRLTNSSEAILFVLGHSNK